MTYPGIRPPARRPFLQWRGKLVDPLANPQERVQRRVPKRIVAEFFSAIFFPPTQQIRVVSKFFFFWGHGSIPGILMQPSVRISGEMTIDCASVSPARPAIPHR